MWVEAFSPHGSRLAKISEKSQRRFDDPINRFFFLNRLFHSFSDNSVGKIPQKKNILSIWQPCRPRSPRWKRGKSINFSLSHVWLLVCECVKQKSLGLKLSHTPSRFPEPLIRWQSLAAVAYQLMRFKFDKNFARVYAVYLFLHANFDVGVRWTCDCVRRSSCNGFGCCFFG